MVSPTFASRPIAGGAVAALARDRGARGGLAERVGQQLHVARARQAADPAQLAQLVHAARVLARDQLPLVLFLVAGDPAPGVHAPDLLVLLAEAELVERDAELGRPALLVVRHLAVPDRVPGGVPLGLAVAQDEVDLAAAGGEVELEAGALVVVAVEADADHVDRVLLEVVAAAGVAVHLRRVVEGADRDVDVPVVVQDLDLGLLRGVGALDRHVLAVVARPLALLPRLVVEAAVDHRRLPFEPPRVVDARRVLAAEETRPRQGGVQRVRPAVAGASWGAKTAVRRSSTSAHGASEHEGGG